MKPFKTLSICIASLLAVLATAPEANLCGYFGNEDEEYFSLFNDALYRETMDAFRLSIHSFGSWHYAYRQGFDQDKLFDGRQEENVADWQRYFGKGTSREEIFDFIYNLDRGEAFAFRDAVVDQERSSAAALIKEKAAARWAFENKKSDLARYLLLSAKCAEVSAIGLPGEEEANELIAEAENGYNRTSSSFLKARYLFQMVRAAHYSYQNEKAVELYKRFGEGLEEAGESSQLIYWAMSQAAGAARALASEDAEMRVYANYHFAKVYAQSPALRLSAYRGMYYKDEADFEAVLQQCANDEERAVVWFLSALDYDRVSLEPFEKVLEIAPQSVWLEHLLAREINKVEQRTLNYMRLPVPTDRSEAAVREYEESYPSDWAALIAFVIKAEGQAVAERKSFWRFAAAYLHFLDGDSQKTREWLKKTQQVAKGGAFLAEVDGLKLLLDIREAEKVDEAFEVEILPLLQKLYDDEAPKGEERYWSHKNRSVFPLACGMLALKYAQQGEVAKSELCMSVYAGSIDYEHYNLYGRPDRAAAADALRDFFEKKQGEYGAFLQSLYPISYEKIVELQGTSRLAEGRLEEAVRIFEELPDDMAEQRPKYMGDGGFYIGGKQPFEARVNDLIYGPEGGEEYTKLTLARQMLALRKKAESSKKQEAADAWFKLANAYYNITYFGPAYGALDYRRSSYIILEEAGNSAFFDCSKAEELYNKAFELSKDAEFKAKCLFMAAKCEQNRFYVAAHEDRWDFEYSEKGSLKAEQYRTYFARLKDDYSDTEYYRMALEECGYLEAYDAR